MIGFFLQRFFLQHRTLQENNHNIALQYVEMRRAGEHAALQARAMAASERHSRQESFLRMAELVNSQLGVTAGLLYLANQRSGGEVSPDPSSELWTRIGEGDTGIFTRKLLELCYGAAGRRRDGERIFYGTPARRRYAAQFVKTFEALLVAARESDASGLLVDAVVMGNAHGHLYRTIIDYRREVDDIGSPVVPLAQSSSGRAPHRHSPPRIRFSKSPTPSRMVSALTPSAGAWPCGAGSLEGDPIS